MSRLTCRPPQGPPPTETPPSPPPPNPVSKKQRKSQKELVPLDQRVILAPKAKKVLTVKEMIEKMNESRKPGDRPTSRGLFNFSAKLKSTDEKNGTTSDPIVQPRGVIRNERNPSQLEKLTRSLYNEKFGEREHPVLIRKSKLPENFIPDEVQPAGTSCQLRDCQVDNTAVGRKALEF